MKRALFILALATVALVGTGNAQSKFGNALKNAAKKAAKEVVDDTKESAKKAATNLKDDAQKTATDAATNAIDRGFSGTTGSNKSTSTSSSGSGSAPSTQVRIPGNALYVSSTTGSNRNDGSKGSPYKNIAKALEVAPSGATIVVAEGNYYGLLNSGNIIITKPVTIIGGYSTDFAERDILKHRTFIQPTAASNGSASGMGTIQIKSVQAPNDYVIIDGFILDRGNSVAYNARGEGKPEGVASPMMNPIGTAGIGGENLDEQQVHTTETAMIYFEGYQGVVNSVNVVVRNCAFLNCPNYGVVGMLKGGSLTLENNIFVNVRMATLDVRGADPKGVIPLTFRYNTVLFVWSRLKDLGDMGYGYRMIPGTSNTIENNIFGCATFSALDRTHVDSDKAREAMRKDVVKNNIFFLNRQTDLTIPGGGMFLRVRANDFDDVEQLSAVSGNKILTDPSLFNGKINKAYLEGFLNLKTSSNMSVDYNSSANQFRSAFGMNLQGTGSTTTSMYANRYPWQDALSLFGAVNGCGAQALK